MKKNGTAVASSPPRRNHERVKIVPLAKLRAHAADTLSRLLPSHSTRSSTFRFSTPVHTLADLKYLGRWDKILKFNAVSSSSCCFTHTTWLWSPHRYTDTVGRASKATTRSTPITTCALMIRSHSGGSRHSVTSIHSAVKASRSRALDSLCFAWSVNKFACFYYDFWTGWTVRSPLLFKKESATGRVSCIGLGQRTTRDHNSCLPIK